MKTTIDIKNLPEIKKKAIDLHMTLKELVNEALEAYIKNAEKVDKRRD
jgi:hypothetical protein